MIDADSLRRPPDQQDLVHDPRDPRGRKGDVDFDPERLAVVVVDDVEGPEAAAVHQRIAHDVGRPGLIGADRLHQRLRGFGFVVALESPADIEFPLAVQAPDSLVIPWSSGLSDQNEQLSESEPGCRAASSVNGSMIGPSSGRLHSYRFVNRLNQPSRQARCSLALGP